MGKDASQSAVEKDKESIVSDSCDEETDDNVVTDSDGNDDCVRDLQGKSGSSWQKLRTV